MAGRRWAYHERRPNGRYDSVLNAVLTLAIAGSQTQLYQCKNALDYPYAARSSVDPRMLAAMPVDYQLTPTELYYSIITAAFRHGDLRGLWECLAYGNSGSDIQGRPIPSWVPDVARPSLGTSMQILPSFCAAAGNHNYVHEIKVAVKQHHLLSVPGIFITAVGRLASLRSYDATGTDGYSQDYIDLQAAAEHSALSSEDVQRSAIRTNTLRTMLAGFTQSFRSVLDFLGPAATQMVPSTMRDWTGIWMDGPFAEALSSGYGQMAIKIWERVARSVPDLGLPENWNAGHPLIDGSNDAEFLDLRNGFTAFQIVAWRTVAADLCRTSDGRIAWVPRHARGDDEIVITALADTCTPLVVRSAGDGTYKIIGPCYVQGVMQGEAMPETADGLQEIVIS